MRILTDYTFLIKNVIADLLIQNETLRKKNILDTEVWLILIGFLKHAGNFLPQDTLKTLYTGIVQPHFRYCCTVWGCCGKTELNHLQNPQNRAARIVTNSSYDTRSKPLFNKLEWKTIEELIADETKMKVFKSLNDLDPNTFIKFSPKSHMSLSAIFEKYH